MENLNLEGLTFQDVANMKGLDLSEVTIKDVIDAKFEKIAKMTHQLHVERTFYSNAIDDLFLGMADIITKQPDCKSLGELYSEMYGVVKLFRSNAA